MTAASNNQSLDCAILGLRWRWPPATAPPTPTKENRSPAIPSG